MHACLDYLTVDNHGVVVGHTKTVAQLPLGQRLKCCRERTSQTQEYRSPAILLAQDLGCRLQAVGRMCVCSVLLVCHTSMRVVWDLDVGSFKSQVETTRTHKQTEQALSFYWHCLAGMGN